MQAKPTRLHLLGFNVQGDLGPMTTYRSARRRIVSFPRVSPLNPASPDQELNRERFSTAATNWRGLTRIERAKWAAAARGAYLRISGYNLFTWWTIRQDAAAIHTIERQSGITLI